MARSGSVLDGDSGMNRTEIENWYRDLQTRLCEGIEAVDGSTSFRSDLWDRPGAGVETLGSSRTVIMWRRRRSTSRLYGERHPSS